MDTTSYCQSPRELLDSGDHLFGRQRRSRRKLPRLVLPGRQNLHVSAADIDHQTFMGKPQASASAL